MLGNVDSEARASTRTIIKAVGPELGVPTKVINDKALSFDRTESISWAVSDRAVHESRRYPVRLAPLIGVPEHTAYIGIAYALL